MPGRKQVTPKLPRRNAPAVVRQNIKEVSALKVRIKFAKQGAMKFIGHLDIMRYFQKAIRRAGY